jgi:cyanate permease
LTKEQRDWLVERLASERAQKEAVHTYGLMETFANPKMWLLTITYFTQNVTGYGLVFFLPLIVKGIGVSTAWIGFVAALPYLCAFVGMIAWGYHSDLTGDRLWHVIISLLTCSFGLAAGILVGTDYPVISMILICIAVTGQMSIAPVFWSIPSAMLTGAAAAGGLAMINAVGNLGGWLGPSVYGLVKDATGSTNLGLLCLSVATVIGAVTLYLAGHDKRLERMMERP